MLLQVAWVLLVALAGVKLLGALCADAPAGGELGLATRRMDEFSYDDAGAPDDAGGRGGGVHALAAALLVALYWGVSVLANVAYVTACGGVGTWYFERAAFARGACCCKPAAVESLGRALTSSFGSICAGSLLVALVQAVGSVLRWIELQAQRGPISSSPFSRAFRCAFALVGRARMFNECASAARATADPNLPPPPPSRPPSLLCRHRASFPAPHT